MQSAISARTRVSFIVTVVVGMATSYRFSPPSEKRCGGGGDRADCGEVGWVVVVVVFSVNVVDRVNGYDVRGIFFLRKKMVDIYK